MASFGNAQNPLHTFPRNFPVHGEVANLLQTCYGETGVMDSGLNGSSFMLTRKLDVQYRNMRHWPINTDVKTFSDVKR